MYERRAAMSVHNSSPPVVLQYARHGVDSHTVSRVATGLFSQAQDYTRGIRQENMPEFQVSTQPLELNTGDL